MIKFLPSYILLILTLLPSFGQEEKVITLETTTGNIEGTLLNPDTTQILPVALIIAGSGPTDRDGNNIQMKNNSLKMLAEGLAENGIASVRYDKRGIGKSFSAGMKEIDLRFDTYIDDTKEWVNMLKNDSRFSSITIIGHSEGSLIGMIACKNGEVDKFVSLAGAGDEIGLILRKQLASQPPNILEESVSIMEKLEQGTTVDTIPPYLFSLFRPSVQPYLISWFKYNPQKELAQLDIPVLIIQGSTDIQISVDDAEKLAAAKPSAEKIIFEGMNHILKEAELDKAKNLKTYNQPDLPLIPGLIESIAAFIKK